MGINILKVATSTLAPLVSVDGVYFLVAMIAAVFLLSGIYGFITQCRRHLRTPFAPQQLNPIRVMLRERNAPTGRKTPKDLIRVYGSPVRFGKHRNGK